jgi:long-subunit fatty acid transport protein
VTHARHAVIGALACLAFSLPAAAQTSLQVPLQFDFINPGAKSLSMAGAFAGLADDATASFANPAGLTALVGPEVSIELRGGPVSTPYLKGGRTSGTPSGLGIDTLPGVVYGNSSSNLAGVSYLSVVLPHRSNRWVVAGYRHELARIDQSFSSNGAFGQDPSEFTARRDFPQDGTRRLDITGYGLAAAFKPTRTVSLGAALAVYQFEFDSEFKRYFVDDFFGSVNRNVSRADLLGYTTQRGSDVSVAPAFGVTVDRGRARFGAIYRRGGSFAFDTTADDGTKTAGQFRVPHTASAGFSYRPAARWLVAGEVTHIAYSRLANDFVSSQARQHASEFHIDSGTELHGAVQYAWLRGSGAPIRLRAGAWFDPDHSVQYSRPAVLASASARIQAETFEAALANGRNQVHLTGGAGVTVTRRVELNVGVDLASNVKLFSSSLIVHLGGTP